MQILQFLLNIITYIFERQVFYTQVNIIWILKLCYEQDLMFSWTYSRTNKQVFTHTCTLPLIRLLRKVLPYKRYTEMCAYKGLVLDPGGWSRYRVELSLSETLGRFLCSLKLRCGDGPWASGAQIVALSIYLVWSMRLFRWRSNGCTTE